VARPLALAAALAVSLLAVSGAGGAAKQEPRRGGTLVLGAPASPLFQEPACLNPIVGPCAGLSLNMRHIVLESPFEVGRDLTWRPRLVSGVTVVRRPPIRLTYNIRPRATWSDGVPVTARDFLFTYGAIRKHAPPEDVHRTRVRSVRALDAKTVQVVLRARFAGWRGLFGPILPEHALRGEDLAKVWTDRIDNPKTGRPIGSGPFLVGRWERGEQLTLLRNERYWESHTAYLQQLVFRFQVSADPGDWFRRDELDVAFGFAPGVVPRLREDPDLRVLSSPGSTWDRFIIRVGSGGHPILKQKLARRALAYGLDRVALTRALVSEGNPKAEPRDSAVYPPQSRFYRPNWSRFRFSAVRARGLLEEAGCRLGADAIYVCGGERLRLRFVTTGMPGGYRARLLDLVPAQLRRIGIEVSPTFATAGAMNQILTSGNFDLALIGAPSFPDPIEKAVLGCGGALNSGGYCQRLVTRDLDQAERILDANDQARALNRADVQVARDVPVIPLFQMPQSSAHRRSVRNFSLSLNSQLNLFWNAEDWWLER
jgi:peptide/nickel transport system substrate-binding protein